MHGCFLNTTPIHCPIDLSSSFESFMKKSNQILLDVTEHSFISYESILEAAGLKSGAFPFMFVYHEDNPLQAKTFKDASSVVRSLSSNVKAKFPLTFSVTVKQREYDHVLELNIDYNASQVSAAVVQSLCAHYMVLLVSASEASKDVIVGALDIVTEEERHL
ncbi:hypothetical protein DL95DRAFT_471771 [Leptodontidium sp. 2 PMI_412]|nr:hypothetical protein DL95DRAFT_471771 [Leptodontidium sp. 2 PMI_412]